MFYSCTCRTLLYSFLFCHVFVDTIVNICICFVSRQNPGKIVCDVLLHRLLTFRLSVSRRISDRLPPSPASCSVRRAGLPPPPPAPSQTNSVRCVPVRPGAAHTPRDCLLSSQLPGTRGSWWLTAPRRSRRGDARSSSSCACGQGTQEHSHMT